MKRWTPIFVSLAMLVMTTAAWACPLCKDSVPSSDAQSPGGVPGGFNTTIYLMLGSLFAVIGMVTMTLVKGAIGVNTARNRGFPLR